MFCIDLSYAVANPYQLLFSLSSQINQELHAQVKKKIFASFCPLKTLNDWISLESLGNITAIRAQQASQVFKRICSQKDTLELKLILKKQPLTQDNYYALIFLSRMLKEIQLSVYCDKESNVHSELASMLKTIPGVLFTIEYKTSALAENENKLVTHPQLLKAFQIQGEDCPAADTTSYYQSIIQYSEGCLKTGAFDLATHVLELLLLSAKMSRMGEVVLLKLQLARLYSHQYPKAAVEPYPESFHNLDDNTVFFLFYIKAYCATLARNTTVAEKYFALCNIHQDMAAQHEHELYQLNIFALFNVIKGNKDLALRLEKRIETAIENKSDGSANLKYINFINLARLYKYNKNFAEAKLLYKKAYQEIAGGGFTASDFIYYNINLGALAESADNHQEAFYFWLKAAVHWLALDNPYSLGWRPKLILCAQLSDTVNYPVDCTKVNDFLIKKLTDLAVKSNRKIVSSPVKSIRLNNSSLKKESCYVTPSGVFYGGLIQEEQDLSTDDKQELHQLVNNLLSMLLPEQHAKTLFIDTYCSEAMPSKHGAIGLAKLNACKQCFYLGENLALNANGLSEDFFSLSSLLQDLIPDEQQLVLRYQRTFMNKSLACPEEIALLNFYRSPSALTCTIQKDSLPAIRRLLDKKVLQFQPTI